jgi:hypothetical protein
MAVGLSKVGPAMALALAPCGARAAEPGLDLARYDCTRAADGETVAASELIGAGYQVASVGRFGAPNVMLADPKTGVRVNCLARPEQPK